MGKQHTHPHIHSVVSNGYVRSPVWLHAVIKAIHIPKGVCSEWCVWPCKGNCSIERRTGVEFYRTTFTNQHVTLCCGTGVEEAAVIGPCRDVWTLPTEVHGLMCCRFQCKQCWLCFSSDTLALKHIHTHTHTQEASLGWKKVPRSTGTNCVCVCVWWLFSGLLWNKS